MAGSGFIIISQGQLLTNQHLVDECTKVTVAIGGLKLVGTVVAEDHIDDLALVKVAPITRSIATFRSGGWIRPGENVLTIGFPLRGLVAEAPSVTTGTVSALAGPGNDTRLIQITAPVQVGSNGSPLLDGSGNIVGIVVAKLDALKVAAATGEIPQNVNFVINSRVAQNSLETNNIEYNAGPSNLQKPAADIAEHARGLTAAIECQR